MSETNLKPSILLLALIYTTVCNPTPQKASSKPVLETWQIIYIIIGIFLIFCTFLVYKLYRNGCIRRFYERFFKKIEEVEFVNVGSEAQNF